MTHLRVAITAISLTLLALSCESQPGTGTDLRKIKNPAGVGARLPRLSAFPGGGVLMSWVEPHTDGHVLKFAMRQDDHWIGQGEVARGADWFINWADFPSVVALDESFWAAHWLVKHPCGGSYEYDIALSLSTDTGTTWSAPQPPHRDGVAAEHGFARIFPVNGEAGIIWLDGREYAKENEHKADPDESGLFMLRYTQIRWNGTMEPGPAGRGLRTVATGVTAAEDWGHAVLSDGGQYFGTPVEIDGNEPIGRVGGTWGQNRKTEFPAVQPSPCSTHFCLFRQGESGDDIDRISDFPTRLRGR